MKRTLFALLIALYLAPVAIFAGEDEATPSTEESTPEQVVAEVEKKRPVMEGVARREVEPRTVVVYDPKAQTRWHGEPVSLSLRDADLVEVLRTFAKLADMSLVVDPGVQGTVTVELHEVPWDQALHLILKTHGLAMEVSGPTLWRVDRSPARR